MNNNIAKLDWFWRGASYSAGYQAILARGTALGYTIPTGALAAEQNTLYNSLNASGIITLLDELKIYMCNNAGLQNFSTINWITPSANQSAVVGVNMTYGVNGWLGGAASALSTGFIAGTHGVKFTLNNAGFGMYVYNDALNNNPDMGSVGSAGAGSRTWIYPRFTATSFQVNVISASAMSTGSNASSLGLHSANRTSSTVQNYYVDAALKQSQGAAAAGTLSDVASYVCGYNNNGATVANNTQGVAMNYHGADLTAKLGDLNTAFTAYKTAIGL